MDQSRIGSLQIWFLFHRETLLTDKVNFTEVSIVLQIICIANCVLLLLMMIMLLLVVVMLVVVLLLLLLLL